MVKKITQRYKNRLSLSILLCGAITLDPHNKFFKKITLTNDLYPDPNNRNQESILKPLAIEAYETEFYEFLNRSTIRQMAYKTLKPLLVNNSKQKIAFGKKTEILKIYLKKYKRLYKKYFIRSPKGINNTINDKTINYFALQTLFFIVGI